MAEVENIETYIENAAPKAIQQNAEVSLFGKWSLTDVEVSDISLVVSFFVFF